MALLFKMENKPFSNFKDVISLKLKSYTAEGV